jgi:hypothetical protein
MAQASPIAAGAGVSDRVNSLAADSSRADGCRPLLVKMVDRTA